MAEDSFEAETVTVAIAADTSAFRRELSEAERLARGFGRVVGDALTGAAVKGRETDDVFRSLVTRLSSLAINAAFRPLEQGVAGCSRIWAARSASRRAGRSRAGASCPSPAAGWWRRRPISRSPMAAPA